MITEKKQRKKKKEKKILECFEFERGRKRNNQRESLVVMLHLREALIFFPKEYMNF